MGHGAFVYYTSAFEFTSGATLSSSFRFDRAWAKMYLHIPTMASGSLYIKTALLESVTFRRVLLPQPDQSTEFIINSGLQRRWVPIPTGFPCYKLESTSGATDTTTIFDVMCADM